MLWKGCTSSQGAFFAGSREIHDGPLVWASLRGWSWGGAWGTVVAFLIEHVLGTYAFHRRDGREEILYTSPLNPYLNHRPCLQKLLGPVAPHF